MRDMVRQAKGSVRTKMLALVVGVALAAGATLALAEPKLWVTSDRLERRTCPSEDCGSVGQLTFREGVTVFEVNGTWSRISKPYSASCNSFGNSQYVKRGNKACTQANGIVDGHFAEWVLSKQLSSERLANPSEGASGDAELVKDSDDFRLHQTQFAAAARTLIDARICTVDDFIEMGGWMKSTNQGPNAYFTYCGGMSNSNKVYLDVSTGKATR